MSFAHLHSHSEASISDGLFGPKKWVEALKDRGYKAHALTDHGVMTNLLPFYKLMRAEKMIPIMGSEFYFVDDPTIKNAENRKSAHIVLIAKNYDGFQNMMRLSKLSYTEGYYYRPRIGMEWLQKYAEGLICLSACQGGVLSTQVWREQDGKETIGLEARFRELQAIFGSDLYVEFQGHVGEGQETVNKAFLDRLRKIPGFQPVVTNDCHYILPEHAKIQDKLKEMAFQSKSDISGQSYTTCDSLWLKGAKDVYETFRENHEYIGKEVVVEGMRNTSAIVEKCADFEFPKVRHYLPKFTDKMDSADIFKRLAMRELKRFLDRDVLHAPREEYISRFKKEFTVISKYGLQDYFLIVWDLIRFANDKGIYVGIGRGSAAGCFISYLLGIVQLDPLEYGLIFERFLNEHRCEGGELPDIDVDIESDRRAEVKEYIFNRYGSDRVCEIGTYGRMKLKTCIIDFGKAFKVADQKTLLGITTNLDLEKDELDDLEAAARSNPKLMRLLTSHPDYTFTVEEIMGQIKSQSIHPAGVVISSQPIAEITPVKTQKNNKTDERVLTTQSEDKHIVAQGLMKVDLLGLKEYDVVRFVLENVTTDLKRESYVLDIMEAERAKPSESVWKMFQKGRTEAVFQFASDGMKQLLVDMRPTHISDLIAANALFRPGCLENGWHTQYCKRKHGLEDVSYAHPIVEETLKETYGVIVYQEQFMEVIHKLGGISLVESDTIRSALGKKDEAKLEKFRERFVEGAAGRIGEPKARELWDQLSKAAGYSFNKCGASKEIIYRNWAHCEPLTIGEMYRLKNGDRANARAMGKEALFKKWQREGYGKAWSMRNGRLHPNRIVDIRYEGQREVYRCITETGRKIDVTINHKFPTPQGEKKLEDLRVGDELYVNLGYKHVESTYRFTDRKGRGNNAVKGKIGFQKVEGSSWALFTERRKILHAKYDDCQICFAELDRKEVHHVDGDHGNQDWENLIVVCSSCHKREHYKMGRTKHGEKGLPVGTEKIISIEFLEMDDVYDVEMEAPAHNFVVQSGIVTCNSHSASYSVLAYISQYLKVHYPAQFWAGQLEWDTRKNKSEDIVINRAAASDMGVEFVLPHINKSSTRFYIETATGRPVWSFQGVKGIGDKTAKEIIKGQPYTSFEDFHERVNKRAVKFNHIQNLIFAGAFDEFGDRREHLKQFDVLKDKRSVGLSDEKLMLKFYEVMGFFEQKLKKVRPGFSKSCSTEGDLRTTLPGEYVLVGGMIAETRSTKTKRGETMGFVTVVDLDERIEVTVFPQEWDAHRSILRVGAIVEMGGTKSDWGGKQNAIEMQTLEEK